eukprot:4870093-Amphidinium_carterae.1
MACHHPLIPSSSMGVHPREVPPMGHRMGFDGSTWCEAALNRDVWADAVRECCAVLVMYFHPKKQAQEQALPAAVPEGREAQQVQGVDRRLTYTSTAVKLQ